jgi:uncharacterized protein YdcH (DUF465 family)
MKLFKRKEKVVDNRSELEKKFEEKGQAIGKKAGEIAQKSVDKYKEVVDKLEQDGKLDKVKELTNKVDDAIDQVVDKVSSKSKHVIETVKKNKKA